MAESMKDYEKELEASFQKLDEGDIVTGTVISIGDEEIILDLKYYAEGIIPVADFSREPGFQVKEEVQIGDEVSATVVKRDDGHGNILLSRVAASDVLSWDKLRALKEEGTILETAVREVVKGGVVVYVEDIRGFIPASRLAASYVEDLDSYLNRKIQVRVFEVDQEKSRLILSAREIEREKEAEAKKRRVSNMQVGLVTEGTVESIQTYGAFVDLGNGLSGLVHISQISTRRIKKVSEVLAVGDQVKVKITAIKDGKISLSMKELEEVPAEVIEEETFTLPEAGEATTSLGALFANIKL